MQQKDGCCYLCVRLREDYGLKPIEEHHVSFGSANRTLSERFGLKVYLCPEHHRTGKESAHLNHNIARQLQQDAQKRFQECYPGLSFLEVFGINYIDPAEEEEETEHSDAFSIEQGFKFI